jgi:predicted XRE-type DNA-binding protein
MKNALTKPSHITTDNIFEDIGFSPEEAAELTIKSDIFLAIRSAIDAAGHTQRDLCRILGEHQPQISNLVNGRISKFSIDRLLRYASRLGLKTTLKIQPASAPKSAKAKPRAKAKVAA